MPPKKTSSPFYEKFALVMIGLLAFGYLIILAKDVFDPLMFGCLFAILLLPVCNFFEQKLRLPRSAASLLSILMFLGFIFGIMYLIGTQISAIANDWPQLRTQVSESISNVQKWVSSSLHINTDKQMTYVHDTTKKILAAGTDVIETTFGAVSSLMLFYVFILIFTFFILFYRRLLMRFMVWVFNEDHSATVFDIIENIQAILRQYILGLLLEMGIVAAVACTIFWIIGIKYAVLLGLIVGLFNIIPYLGIFTALLLSVIITFATGTINQTLGVAVSVIGIHAVDSNLLLPTVVGSKVRLNALVTFLGIIFGEMIWGLSGMFLSIPVLAILKIIFDRVESLKPWGFLLGGAYEYKKSAEKEMKTE
jgi:predicted PurR-regulated permease PerM